MNTDQGRLFFAAGLDNAQLRTDAQESRNILRGISDTAVQEGDKMEKMMKNVGKTIAAAFTVKQAQEFASQIIKVRSEIQSLEISFETLLGNKQKASQMFGELRQFAVATPMMLKDLAQGAQTMLAFNIEAEKVMPILKAIGDISMGDAQKFNSLALAFSQMSATGRLMGQDLLQMINAGFNPLSVISEKTEQSIGDLKDEMEKGKITVEMVTDAFITATSEGGKFYGMLEKQSHGIAGSISNLQGAIDDMFNEIGHQSEGFIANTLDAALIIAKNWKIVGNVLAAVIAGYGTYKAAILAITVVERIKARVTAEAALQTKLAAMQGIALSEAEAIAAAKTKLLSLAFNGLKAAIMANPIGLILGALAAVATAIGLFSSNTEDASVAVTKYGKSAAEQLSKVDTLVNIIKGSTTASKTQKTAIEELNGILKEYGLQAIKEGENIDEVNRKRAQAIELIKQEAIERQRANNLDAGAEKYSKASSDAKNQLYKDLQGAMTESFLLVDNNELQQNAEAITTIIADVVQSNISKIAGKTGEEYQNGLNEIYATIQDRMRAIGISESTIAKQWMTDGLFNHQNLVQNFVNTQKKAKEQYDSYTDAIEKNAKAERQAADSSMTYAEKVSATERALKGSSGKVKELYNNIKNLMSQYSKNTIGFDIVFNAEPPKWMASMDIPELQRLATMFSALGKNNPNGANVNGKYFTQQELLQRGADYAQAAKNKQDKVDAEKANAEAIAEENKRKAEEAKRKAEREKKEQQQIQQETNKRNEQITKYANSAAIARREAEFEIEQAGIDAMAEGIDKTLKQNELNYKRLTFENQKRKDQMLEDLRDVKELEWENANPTAKKDGKSFDRTTIGDNYISQDKVDELRAAAQSAIEAGEQAKAKTLEAEAERLQGQVNTLKEYERIALDLRTRGNQEAINTMLEDVRTYEQQRTDITAEYEAKRRQLYELDKDGDYKKDADGNKILRKGVEQGNVDELNYQEEQALSGIDEQFAMRSDEYQAWCETITDISLKQLNELLAEAKKELEQMQAQNPNNPKLAQQRAKVDKLQKNVNKKNAETEVAPKKKTIKEWDDLYSTLQDCENQFEAIGQAVGGTVGEIMSAAGNIASSSLSMINGIVQLVNMSSTGMTATATAGAKAISTMEKASLILTIITAAMQIAMTIANLFNGDKTKQKEIDKLQSEIDNLEWELGHQEIMRYSDVKTELNRVRNAIAGARSELAATITGWNRFILYTVKATKNTQLLTESAENLADIYSSMSYTADKALGVGKYKEARAQLENIAKQQVEINDQIEYQKSLKKPDEGAIKDAEQKMAENAQKAIEIINNLVEDIIGDSASGIAEELADAFIDAFKEGEDAAQAWGDKVDEIVGDILKKMLVQKFLEEPMGEIFNKYKAKWFPKGEAGDNFLDVVIGSMGDFANDLNGTIGKFNEAMDYLPDELKQYFTGEAEREGADKGIASASQDSIDELNGRMTAVQSHTYNICQDTKLLLNTTNSILRSVMNIESETDGFGLRMERVESHLKEVKDTLSDINRVGLKIK